MRILKTIWEWLIRNLGNVFSILGFFLTMYFGIFYVPSYLRESQNERLKNAQNEIQQSVKELVFSDSTFAITELTSLVHAKELTLNEKFPLSLSDILTKAEESFMEDRYLPLSKRKDLIKKIEVIKLQLPKEPATTNDKQKSESKGILWLELLSIIITLIATIIGVISTITKYLTEKDKQEEIVNETQEVFPDKEVRQSAYEFENKIYEVLKDIPDIQLMDRNYDRGIDFQFSLDDKNYFVEVKYLSRSKVGLSSVHQFAHFLSGHQGEGWLIYNTDLTTLVRKAIDDFNQLNNQIQIKPIRITNERELANKIKGLLKK